MLYGLVSEPDKLYTGNIALVEPAQRDGGTFTTARVYIDGASFQPGQLLTGKIPVVGRGWWIPGSAVVGLGTNSVVFKKENNVFVPKKVLTGIRTHGLVLVTESITGWEIARNASYLVDNESFIQTSDKDQP